MASYPHITLELDGHLMRLALFDEAAPRACAALRARLPLRGEIVHAMWSGPLCLINDQRLDDAPLENHTVFLAPGDAIYHPIHHEIGLAYEATQFREPIGSAYVSLIGRILDDLEPLVRVGQHLQRSGAKLVVLRTSSP